MTINDGGPAFPHMAQGIIGNQQGMTLREWYAGQALAGVDMNNIRGTTQELAESMYEIADAMIAAREEQDDPRDPDVEYDRATEQGVRHE